MSRRNGDKPCCSTHSRQEARAEVLDECNFELAVAHLRIPEMV
jgi:hypothetical protein